MSKGTRLILILSVVVGLGVALVPPIADYSSCETARRAYSEDQQDWMLVLKHSKTLQQASDRSLKRAYADTDFREGRWSFPVCRLADGFAESMLLGATAFVLFFVGTHLAWLACRAFNKLMERLK